MAGGGAEQHIGAVLLAQAVGRADVGQIENICDEPLFEHVANHVEANPPDFAEAGRIDAPGQVEHGLGMPGGGNVSRLARRPELRAKRRSIADIEAGQRRIERTDKQVARKHAVTQCGNRPIACTPASGLCERAGWRE